MSQYGKERFVNPYNFTQTDYKKKKTSNGEEKASELFTGYIGCNLITKTPLAIPDSNFQEELEHKTYGYFHYINEEGKKYPVISGSSLRGSIRSIYETVTDSCFSTTDINKIITHRVNAPFKPGVLIREELDTGEKKWKLYEAHRNLLRRNDSVLTQPVGKGNSPTIYTALTPDRMREIGLGSKVYIREKSNAGKTVVEELMIETPREFQKDNSIKEGYLYIGESIVNKKFESVFTLKNDRKNTKKHAEVIASNLEKAMEQLNETLKVYNDSKVNVCLSDEEQPHYGYPGYEQALENGVLPIWYSKSSKDEIYLSMACIGRVAYAKTMGDLLGEKKPCTKRTKVCRACALFGMTSEESLGSKIRITDAIVENWEEKKSVMKSVTLRELAGPKESYLPFYADLKGRENLKFESYDTGINIRGRKFYWHGQSKDYYKMAEKTKRNATMDLIKPEVTFCFKVFYNQITKEQLDELLWVLTLGENHKESTLCYKIGRGKPLGLGSAKIMVTEHCQREFSSDYKIQSLDVEQPELFQHFDRNQPDCFAELITILDMKSSQDMNVEYPSIPYVENPQDKNANAGYQWFSSNYKLGSNYPQYVLPRIKEADVSLPKKLEEKKSQDKDKKNKSKNTYNTKENKTRRTNNAKEETCGTIMGELFANIKIES